MKQLALSSTSFKFYYDFKSKLQDCSFLEHTVLWFSCHFLADGFLVGFSFLHFMFLLPSFYIFIELFLR